MTDESPEVTANLRVVVVDDSAYNRQTITAMLESLPGIEVVGRAMNGKEALKLAFDLEPDVITLDLEMPEMDGFAFLRLLMNKRPTPVIVVSGYAQRENVFRALELGALDFVAKPGRHISPDLRNIEDELLMKIGLVRKLQAVRLRERAEKLAAAAPAAIPHAHTGRIIRKAAEHGDPAAVVAIASSTGGPPAVQHVLAGLPEGLPIAVFVAQHMPARFTRAFAERLDRIVPLSVVEAGDGQPVRVGVCYVSPGSKNVEVERGAGGAVVRVVEPPAARRGNTLTPSGDHLFKSLAPLYGDRLCTVVLTGMGSDGSEGVVMAKKAGGHVVCEDPETAVMPGMPFSAVETGCADAVLPLEEISGAIAAFVARRASAST